MRRFVAFFKEKYFEKQISFLLGGKIPRNSRSECSLQLSLNGMIELFMYHIWIHV